MPAPTRSTRTLVAATLALLGFAGNSLLCRMALGARSIDAWSFTAVRIGGGALALALLQRIAAGGRAGGARAAGSFGSALALYGYAAAFSLAYLRLGAGVGALVLFASVQATMIGWSTWRGARPSRAEWTGLAVALAGLALLTLPGASLRDRLGLALMALAGVAWGVYSLRGRGERAPLDATSGNFARSVPLAFLAALVAPCFEPLHATARGAALALASGALASGLGYSLWYLALPGMSATRAALVQLVVPVLAAAGGAVLLDERLTLRFALSGALILGGVGGALLARGREGG